MKTKIIKISDDQNTITHKSGVVTVFEESNKNCSFCIYFNKENCNVLLCSCSFRFDEKSGIFKLKQP